MRDRLGGNCELSFGRVEGRAWAAALVERRADRGNLGRGRPAAAADEPRAEVKSFVDKYKAKYNSTPDSMAALAHDAMYLLKNAIEKSNMTGDLAAQRKAVRDAAQALALAKKHPGPIHILVTDVVMPGLSGSQLAGRLLSERPDMRVLYISGYPEDSIAHHGVLDREQHFLQKPFPPGQFLEKVREVLDVRAAR